MKGVIGKLFGKKVQKFMGRQILFPFLKEYLNILTWQPNPLYQNSDITGYRIYRLNGKRVDLIDKEEHNRFEYLHPNTEQDSYTYAVADVGMNGVNGESAVVNIE